MYPRLRSKVEPPNICPMLDSKKNDGLVDRFVRNRIVVAGLGVLLLTSGSRGAAETGAVCPGGVSLSSFRLVVEPPQDGKPLPVNVVNVVKPGEKLHYEPVHLPEGTRNSAHVAIIIVPPEDDPSAHLQVLEPRPAKTPADWAIPVRAAVVGLVFGEHGLDVKKISALVQKNPQLVSQLADYAEKTSTVEALVQTLSKYEQAPPGSSDLDSVLKGFSSQYGVSMPKIDSSTSPDQTASALLRAVVPAFAASDSGSATLTQQSTGLAAGVAAMFLGNPVGLAAGGAALVENLHKTVFPATDFRPAFAQPAPHADDLNLCTANDNKKAHSREAYLWMLRVPNSEPPPVKLAGAAHLPLGWTSAIKVSTDTNSQLRLIPRARDWKLVSGDHEISVPVKVESEKADDSLVLDLAHVKAAAGQYKLAAMWDWTPMVVAGNVDLHSVSDFSGVKLTQESQDHLIAGAGGLELRLVGADFEFLDNVSLRDPAEPKAHPTALEFELPKGKQAGPQDDVEVDVDTTSLKPGSYVLALKQVNGSSHDVPFTVHPPNPKIENAPVKVNLGETQQTVQLHGSNLELIAKINSPDAEWNLSPVADAHGVTERDATVKLDAKASKGEKIPASVFVAGMETPIQIPDAVQVLGPRPKVVNVSKSFASQTGVELHGDELPSGVATSFALRTENLDSRPSLSLQCADDNRTKRKLTLGSGQTDGGAQLDAAGQGTLFLSVDPGVVGDSGCVLQAVITGSSGPSDAYTLGHIILLPRIDSFTISSEQVGPNLYAGTLTGRDLQVIAKTGWDDKTGTDVQGIPTPVPGTDKQTLKIAVPWPPPSPQAPLRVWLQGEDQSRGTSTKY